MINEDSSAEELLAAFQKLNDEITMLEVQVEQKSELLSAITARLDEIGWPDA